MTDSIKPDCRHYLGDKPCGRGEDCAGCAEFAPLGSRVLIVKLGALGDVLRTTPLLRGLAEQLPGAEIIWLTSPASAVVLKNNPLIDQLWLTGSETLARLAVERFERVICLDKEPRAAACATLAAAPIKQGFGWSEAGRLIALNQAAEYSLCLGLSDELKFRRNQKTYQQLIFEMAELTFRPDYNYVLALDRAEAEWADEFLAGRISPQADIIIGFNLGGGDVFANKCWKEGHFLKLRRLIHQRWGEEAAVLALGGEAEADRMARLCGAEGPAIIPTGAQSIGRFAALLARCHLVVTGDSLGMHLALAVGTSCLVLIGSTTPQEIELYGRGEMIVSEMDCSPCYKSVCPQRPDCMDLFRPEAVMARLEGLINGEGSPRT
ncbi:MAG: glycosyltransferase family 9 protein [Deltaproteobacteria bacterium]|nr:glycosyltransferase family 9 protein [Deltaproteobacteria bacterium]